MHSHGSRHILVLPFTVCHVCLLHLVAYPCYPCPSDAYATLTGIDYARDWLLEISIWQLGSYWQTDILWSVNKLARAVTKWTKACDERLARLISYIHSSYMWTQAILLCGIYSTTMQIRIISGLWFCRRPWRLKVDFRWISVHFRNPNICAYNWMCRKQTSVTHCSSEAEVISLDAGLRMDGIPALDPWDSVIEVFHSSPYQANKTKDVRESRGNLSANTQRNMQKQIPTTHTNLDLTNIDHVPSSVTHSGSNTVLHVFEDNEAVIKMIIKGRSPTMRHVSRTHRVALDWLLDKINLDSKIQIRYIDTKHQLADILT